jgi:predicted nicotinamide N-methyase
VQDRESLIQNAASLLAICSGTAAAGVIVRDFVFTVQYLTTSRKLNVHLKDVPLDNGDYGSVGAQTWGGACVLADAITNDPKRFGLLCNSVRKDLRILELGAGTGLVSLTIGKLVEHAPAREAPAVDIIATDYYPSVLANLDSNIQSNFPTSSSSPQGGNAIRISSHSLDWSSFAATSPASFPFHEPFDLLGADIIYEVQHASWIKSCLERLLLKLTRSNSSGPGPTFHLVIPLCLTHSVESDTVENVFPKIGGFTRHEAGELKLGILDKETIVCEAGDGLGTDQIEYVYYVIGWS